MVFKWYCSSANLTKWWSVWYLSVVQCRKYSKFFFIMYVFGEMFSDPTNEWLNTDVCSFQQFSLLQQSSLTSVGTFVYVVLLCTPFCLVHWSMLIVHPVMGCNLILSPFKFFLRFWVKYKLQNMVYVVLFISWIWDHVPSFGLQGVWTLVIKAVNCLFCSIEWKVFFLITQTT